MRRASNPLSHRLDRIERKLDELLVASARQAAICQPARRQLAQVERAVYGNGRDGLLTRVARLETVRRLANHAVAAAIGLGSALLTALLTWWLERV